MTITPLHDPFASFGVGRLPGSDLAEMVQRLGPGLTDHRGLIDLPALTVLFDDLGGLPFFAAEPGSSIQSRLSMSMVDRPDVDEVLTATAQLAMSSGDYGATTVQIRGRDDRALCVGTARNVRVGRALVTDGDHFEIPDPAAPQGDPSLGRGTLPAGDEVPTGREVIAAIEANKTTVGQFAALLGGSVELAGDDAVRFRSKTAPWMANIMGTMHGGVIAAIVAQGLSFAGQAAAPAGVGYQVIDFSVSFLRSPQVDGRTITVSTTPVKVGRRLGVFAAELHDGDTLLAHATADVRFGD